MRYTIRIITALAVLATCVALGVACSKHEALPTAAGNLLVKPPAPPAADSPANALRLFQWCWVNRDASLYATVFTDDYCGRCSARDSVGSGYPSDGCVFSRGDEVQIARHLFETGIATEPPASGITFDFTSDLVAVPDARPGKDPGWHKQIHAQALLRINVGEYSTEVKGPGLFYLVRGDSALIAPDLLARGFGPDPNRWYVERWEDETASGMTPVAAVRPARPMPARSTSWCQIKARYR